MKKTLRNLVLSSSVLVLVLSAANLHAAVTGGAPVPPRGRAAIVISALSPVLGLY